MSSQNISIDDLRSSYEKFVDEVNEKTNALQNNRYDTFERDLKRGKLGHLLGQEHIKENLQEIKFAYSFVRMEKDIFDSEFVQLLKVYAEQFGFEPSERLFEALSLELLAIDLVLHHPLWSRRTYDSSDFRGIGFVRDESTEGMSITKVAYIPLLGMRFDERKKPIEIRPTSWSTIRTMLRQLEPRES